MPSLRWQLIAIVVAGCASEAVDRLYVRRFFQIGIPDGVREIVVIGALGIIESLVGIALVRIIRHRVGGVSTAFVTAALLGVTAVGVVVIVAVSLLAAASIGFVLQGGMRQATSTTQLVWTNTFAPSSSRATVHSFAGQAQSLGEISGGALFGVITSVLTLRAAFAGSALLYVVAAVCALVGARRWSGSAVSGS